MGFEEKIVDNELDVKQETWDALESTLVHVALNVNDVQSNIQIWLSDGALYPRDSILFPAEDEGGEFAFASKE